MARIVDGAPEELPVALGTVIAQRHPHLQRPEPARHLRTAVEEVERLEFAALIFGEVTGRDRERLLEHRGVLDEHTTAFVGHAQPLVPIERHRVGPLDPCKRQPELGQHRPEGTNRPVDVEPELLALGDIGQRVEVVDRPHVDRTGMTDDRKGGHPLGAVVVDHLVEGGGVDGVVGIARDTADRMPAEAERVSGALERHVGLVVGHVDRELSGAVG